MIIFLVYRYILLMVPIVLMVKVWGMVLMGRLFQRMVGSQGHLLTKSLVLESGQDPPTHLRPTGTTMNRPDIRHLELGAVHVLKAHSAEQHASEDSNAVPAPAQNGDGAKGATTAISVVSARGPCTK